MLRLSNILLPCEFRKNNVYKIACKTYFSVELCNQKNLKPIFKN